LSTGSDSESSLNNFQQAQRPYPLGFNDFDDAKPSGRGILQKNNRKFTDGYEQEQNDSWGDPYYNHAGSSGAARKVMDFFRRRGRDRGN
jgi:protein-serine/threonine kinase